MGFFPLDHLAQGYRRIKTGYLLEIKGRGGVFGGWGGNNNGLLLNKSGRLRSNKGDDLKKTGFDPIKIAIDRVKNDFDRPITRSTETGAASTGSRLMSSDPDEGWQGQKRASDQAGTASTG